MQKFCNIIFSVFLFVSFSATAQHKVSKHASQLQLEVFGEGGLFSLNYDARFAKKENGIGFSLGLGGTPLGLGGYSCNSGFHLPLPIGLNYLAGKNKHLLEMGAGFVPVLISGTKVFCTAPPDKKYFFSDNTEGYGYLLAGYRYQPINKKLTYRIFISPLFQKGFNTKFWGGASIGIRL